MAFIGILLILFPMLAVIIGFIVALFCFIGICLLLIGISGTIMNKLYKMQTKSEQKVVKTWNNITSIILGLFIILLPLGVALYEIFALFFNAK